MALGAGRLDLCICSLSLALFTSMASFAAPIHLKVGATGDGLGSSWSNACSNLTDAVAALNASSDSPAELRIAGGVYDDHLSLTITHANFAIKGGYRAASDGDETRDFSEYQTIFFPSTEAKLSKLTLTHCRPNETGLAIGTSDTKYFYADGKLQFPEDNGWYTGVLDCYNQQNDTCGTIGAIALTVDAGSGGSISGVSFVGGHRQSQLKILANALDTVVEDCGFYCGYPNAYVSTSAKTVFRRCSFRFHAIGWGGGVLRANNADCVIEDCLFADNIPTWFSGMHLVNTMGVMTNCVFRRNLVYCSDSSDRRTTAGLLYADTGSRIVGTAFSNNFHSIAGTYNVSPVLALGATFERCRWSNNLLRVNPQSGLTYAFVQSTYKAYNNTFDGCLFASNRVEGVATPTGDFAMSLVAGSIDGSKLAVVNSTFLSNEVVAVDADTVTASLSRGVLTRATSTTASASQLGIANCTFAGAAVAGVKDVIQLGTAHAQPLVIVNSIFQTDAVVPVDPFAFSVPSVVSILDCTFKNMLETYRPTDYDLTAGLETDEVPHVLDGPIYRPAAKTPGLRASADVGVTGDAAPRTYQFRPRGETAWSPLVAGMMATVADSPAPISDAAGAARAFGSMTRGAVQVLKEPAETGVSLTVRLSPLTGGSVTKPATQATVKNGAIEAVTATASGSSTFSGWYETDDTLYASAAKLEIASLTDDLVLVAKFATRAVTVTFDLDGKGTFDENGEDTIDVIAHVGEAFPSVPAHHLDDGWVLYDAKTPTLVPDTEESIVIQPEIISSGVRTVYASPEGAGSRDGSSWGNAYGSLGEAIADAGKIRGEVWLKGGKYVFSTPLTLKSNVTLRGGFAGTESVAGAADPKAHPTVLTGDVNGDDTWFGYTASSGKSVATGVAVWDGLSFNPPNPEGTHDYWSATGNISENATIGFSSSDASVTNVGFFGVTFADFRYAAVYNLGYWDGLFVSNCTFVACGGSSAKDSLNEYYRTLHGRTRGHNTVVGSMFVGNTRALHFDTLADGGDTTNVISRCTLWGNNTYGISILAATAAVTRIEHLHAVSNGVGTWVSFYAAEAKDARHTLADSVFFANRLVDGNSSVYAGSRVSRDLCTHITGCLFEKNVLTTKTSGTMGISVNGHLYCNLFVDRCTWLDNTLNMSGGDNSYCASVACCANIYCQIYLTDCTFARNRIVSSDYTATGSRVGILAKQNHFGTIRALNCSFCDNAFTAGHEANEGECVLFTTQPNNPLLLVNCAISNADGHRVYCGVSGGYGEMRNCAVTAFDVDATGMPSANVTTNAVTIADPQFSHAFSRDAQGFKAWGLWGASPFRKRAYPPGVDANGYTYYYDPTQSSSQPWRGFSGGNLTVAQAEEKGISFENLKPDAFDQRRDSRKCALGSLNPTKCGFLLFMR